MPNTHLSLSSFASLCVLDLPVCVCLYVLPVLLLWAYNESYLDDVNMPSTLVRQGNIPNVAVKELYGSFRH